LCSSAAFAFFCYTCALLPCSLFSTTHGDTPLLYLMHTIPCPCHNLFVLNSLQPHLFTLSGSSVATLPPLT
jgi:hypothetical protein